MNLGDLVKQANDIEASIIRYFDLRKFLTYIALFNLGMALPLRSPLFLLIALANIAGERWAKAKQTELGNQYVAIEDQIDRGVRSAMAESQGDA